MSTGVGSLSYSVQSTCMGDASVTAVRVARTLAAIGILCGAIGGVTVIGLVLSSSASVALVVLGTVFTWLSVSLLAGAAVSVSAATSQREDGERNGSRRC